VDELGGVNCNFMYFNTATDNANSVIALAVLLLKYAVIFVKSVDS
jgi:hypothetical protein